MNELEKALEEFQNRYRFYLEKVDRRYKQLGDNDYDVVQAAWSRYLKLRKARQTTKKGATE
jgi:nickel-dependent lactate racemase